MSYMSLLCYPESFGRVYLESFEGVYLESFEGVYPEPPPCHPELVEGSPGSFTSLRAG